MSKTGLDPIFDELRGVPAGDTLPAVRAWAVRVDARTAGAGRMRPGGSGARRVRLAALCVAVLAAACSVPLEHDRTFAHVLSGRIALPPNEARAALARLGWVEPATATVLGEVFIDMPGGKREIAAYVGSGEALVNGRKIITPTSTFAIVLPRGGARRIERWERSLREMDGVLRVEREAMRTTVREPAYKAVLETFEFQFNARLGEAEVERRIQRHLDGVLPGQVKVTHTPGPDGTRSIRLTGSGTIPPEQARKIEAFLRETQRP